MVGDQSCKDQLGNKNLILHGLNIVANDRMRGDLFHYTHQTAMLSNE